MTGKKRYRRRRQKEGHGDGGQKGKKEKEENPRVRSVPRGLKKTNSFELYR